MKHEKVILFPPNMAFGDAFSVIGLSYYLLEHYETVYFYIGTTYINGYTIPPNILIGVTNYITHHFKNDPLFNNRIKIIGDAESLINQGKYGEYHICNTLTGDWSGPNRALIDLPNIDKDYYFNDENPIYNKLDIPEKYKCSPNKHLPSTSLQTNHIFYYELVGLNNNVRMDYFNYVRNIDDEIALKDRILTSNNITDGKYNIINDPQRHINSLIPFITNGYATIDINYLADNPCQLITLLEGAECIHFVEGSNVNFFYHAQYKDIFKYDKEINFHIWCRNRNWPGLTMNLDYAWTMMDNPRLNNWNFKFEQ